MDNNELADALPPETVLGGKYAVSRCLGVGGMGAVYEAQNTWTGRRAALRSYYIVQEFLLWKEMSRHTSALSDASSS